MDAHTMLRELPKVVKAKPSTHAAPQSQPFAPLASPFVVLFRWGQSPLVVALLTFGCAAFGFPNFRLGIPGLGCGLGMSETKPEAACPGREPRPSLRLPWRAVP